MSKISVSNVIVIIFFVCTSNLLKVSNLIKIKVNSSNSSKKQVFDVNTNFISPYEKEVIFVKRILAESNLAFQLTIAEISRLGYTEDDEVKLDDFVKGLENIIHEYMIKKEDFKEYILPIIEKHFSSKTKFSASELNILMIESLSFINNHLNSNKGKDIEKEFNLKSHLNFITKVLNSVYNDNIVNKSSSSILQNIDRSNEENNFIRELFNQLCEDDKISKENIISVIFQYYKSFELSESFYTEYSKLVINDDYDYAEFKKIIYSFFEKAKKFLLNQKLSVSSISKQ